MMEIKLLQDNGQLGAGIQASPEVFEREYNEALVHRIKPMPEVATVLKKIVNKLSTAPKSHGAKKVRVVPVPV